MKKAGLVSDEGLLRRAGLKQKNPDRRSLDGAGSQDFYS